jgi:hypothetical protein
MSTNKTYIAKFTPQISIEVPENWDPTGLRSNDEMTAREIVEREIYKFSWRQLQDLMMDSLDSILQDNSAETQTNILIQVSPDSEHLAERNGAAAWVQFEADRQPPVCPYWAGTPQEAAWRRGWNKGA